MDSKQGRYLMTLYSVNAFLDRHADRLPKAVGAGVRKRLDETLAEVAQHVQTQHASPLIAQGLTRTKQERRDALLRDHMGPIARIARLAAPSMPELAPIKMPRGAPGMQKLLAHAEGMAVIAEHHRDVFIDAGLRPTFVDDLRAAIDELQDTLAERTNRYGDQAGATEGLGIGLVAANRYKAVLDSFIRSEAHGDVELLADWAMIKRVPRPPGRRRTKGDAAAATATDQKSAADQREQTPSSTEPIAQPIADPARLLSEGSADQSPSQSAGHTGAAVAPETTTHQ